MICPSCQSENDEGAEVCFTCRHRLATARPALTTGSVIGARYEILSTLGKGGMGMVYKAHDRVLDETVAVKVLRSEIATDPDMARRFRSEIKLARKIRHPNVCGIHEYGEEGRLRYIAMEYVEGTDLKQILKAKGGLPPEEAFEVAVQVSEGLQAIHEVGVIHRDLKTPNIMRDSRGLVRLMDFGIAKQYGEATLSGTAMGMVVGTPEYMSPEQGRGEKIDFRSDIYALGIVIYELLTGRVPFKGETPIATIFKHIEEPPPLYGPEAAALPAPLVAVLAKALAKSPAERYATAKDLSDALREARALSFSNTATAVVPSPTRSATAPQLERMPLAAAPTPMPTAVPTVVPTRIRPADASSEMETRVRTPPPSRLAAEAGRTAPTPRTGAYRAPAASTPARARAEIVPSGRPAPTVGLRLLWLVVPVVLVIGAAGLALVARVLLRAPAPEPTATAPASETMTASPQAPGAQAPRVPEARPPAQVIADAPPPAPLVTQPPVVDVPRLEPPERRAPPPPARPAASTKPATSTARAPVAADAAPVSPRQPRTEPRAETSTIPLASVSQPAPAPAVPAQPPAEEKGHLQIAVVPWAEVTVDGRSLGPTPLPRVPLTPGAHVVVLNHPGYQPLQRRVTIRAGETFKLVVDLADMAIPRKP